MMAEDLSRLEIFEQCVKETCEEFSDFLPNEIPVLYEAPDALTFYRNYLSPNIPFVVKNGVRHWPAIVKWNNEYLRSQLRDKRCTVSVTPDGYADAVVDDLFMLPHERKLPFSSFISEMENPSPSAVFYLQKQDNCLHDEFATLIPDVEDHIPWATKAIGALPDAANFWMGDQRAITSLHKDNYENIYCVVTGSKDFILHPPVAAAWMPYEKYQMGRYLYENDEFEIEELDGETKWISLDASSIDHDMYPLSLSTKEYRCHLEAGDMLYLPSLWFHHVRQSHGCIAINYWYEMKHDGKYCYFNFLDKLRRVQN